MSEFSKVMRQWRRMCTKMYDSMDDNKLNMCNLCPLDACDCNMNFDDSNKDVDYEEIEETVMQWAAEHPEPVYPTWGAWLIQQGIAEIGSGMLAVDPVKAAKPIPADMAQKLGIEPKEG